MPRDDERVFPAFARDANEMLWAAARAARAEGDTEAYESWLYLARKSDDLVDQMTETVQ